MLAASAVAIAPVKTRGVVAKRTGSDAETETESMAAATEIVMQSMSAIETGTESARVSESETARDLAETDQCLPMPAIIPLEPKTDVPSAAATTRIVIETAAMV